MASDLSDEDIFDYDDEGASDMDYDDGDSSINEGTPYSYFPLPPLLYSRWLITVLKTPIWTRT
jgi:hypothetical protein